ncbi:hypothetical protein [Arthrobacter sp. B1I2]|uniref:hypothetical protein n=1 Tax=Arthrobacter sp. B1I2 TaxID=3042263 RepID=UPI002784CA41|nr:hypothetical protein [Arthrobacter sp. B1I2]MDQ0733498.1 hypothetical protein [Arthrobacter sp. B1I2]
MLLPILLIVGAVGVLGWAAYAAPMLLRPRIAAKQQAKHEHVEAGRELVRRNPLDYVRAFFSRIAPTRLKLEQAVKAAQDALASAEKREARLLSGFTGGIEPNHRSVVVTFIMFGIWVVSVVAHALIELPIITAVSGGDLLFGFLGTLLALSIPVIASLQVTRLVRQRRQRKIEPLPFSLAMAGILTAFIAVVVLLTALAPIRAEVEYQDKIRTVEQQIAQYTEDGDDNALLFAQRNLEELRRQQIRSAEWNQALVPIAAMAEFASGFSLPVAIPLVQLRRIRREKAAAQSSVIEAENAVALQRASEYQELSTTFQDAGVTQADLQGAVATMANENTAGPLPLETGNRVAADPIPDTTGTEPKPTGPLPSATPHPSASPEAPTPTSAARPSQAFPQNPPSTTPATPAERAHDVLDDSFDLS